MLQEQHVMRPQVLHRDVHCVAEIHCYHQLLEEGPAGRQSASCCRSVMLCKARAACRAHSHCGICEGAPHQAVMLCQAIADREHAVCLWMGLKAVLRSTISTEKMS